MRKIRLLLKNTSAISVLFDTILFLMFLSIAGVILLPAFVPSNIMSTSKNIITDNLADETLESMLRSTPDEFEYILGTEIIDSFAENLGININESQGLYRSLTRWILGRQQFHKTYAEHISELLFCMVEFPISNNKSISINLLTKNYDQQLISDIQSFLDASFNDEYQYNFVASWRPIRNISLGGRIEIGDCVPNTNVFTVAETISMPFIPIICIKDEVIVLSRNWVIEKMDQYVDSIPVLQSINSSLLLLQNSNCSDVEIKEIQKSIQENITSLFIAILCDGVKDENNITILPGVLSNLLDTYLQGLSSSAKHCIQDVGFSQVNVVFNAIEQSENHMFSSYMKNILCDMMSHVFVNSTMGSDQLYSFLKNNILSSVSCELKSLIHSCVQSLISDEILRIDVYHLIYDIIDQIFSMLSFHQATVSLTLWNGMDSV